MSKTKKRKFKVHAILEAGQDRRLELMFNSTLERVTVRAVVDDIPQKPYVKSDVLYDERGAFFVVGGGLDSGEVAYSKLYLDKFKRVRG